jgi:hypothetical protein
VVGIIYLNPNGDGVALLADEEGNMLDGVTFLQMQDKLRARILANEAGLIATIFGRLIGAPGIKCASRPSWHPKLLVALAALAFAVMGLQAQLLDPIALPRKLSDPVRSTQPAITCTTGRAALIGHAGRQAAIIEMVVALGGAYVVLGGVMFASVASFRLPSDKIDSFFALLIPKPADIPGLRTVPLDEDFSPFNFEQVRKPRAKLKSSDLASGRPPAAATSPNTTYTAGARGSTVRPVPARPREKIHRSEGSMSVLGEAIEGWSGTRHRLDRRVANVRYSKLGEGLILTGGIVDVPKNAGLGKNENRYVERQRHPGTAGSSAGVD